MLFVIDDGRSKFFRASTEAGPIEGLEDLRQPLDALVGVRVPGLQIVDLLFQSFDAGCLCGHGQNHRLQGLNIIGKLDLGSRHGFDQNIFCRDPPVVSGR